MVEKSKINTKANEILKTQIDASIGIARTVVQSWLPDPKPGEKMDDDEDQEALFNKFSTGRPDRLGLGAKYLSHNQAMKISNESTSANIKVPTKQQIQLKNKILNQNQRLSSKKKEEYNDHKRSRYDIEEEEEDDDESSKKGTLNKKNKKIGGQGDFLSMYLNERSNKKKKSKGK
ncbi:unnamed protein product [Cunninghamella echinulata]